MLFVSAQVEELLKGLLCPDLFLYLFAFQKGIVPDFESDASEHLGEKLGRGLGGQMFSSRHDTACSPHALPCLCCCLTLPLFSPGQLNTLAPRRPHYSATSVGPARRRSASSRQAQDHPLPLECSCHSFSISLLDCIDFAVKGYKSKI